MWREGVTVIMVIAECLDVGLNTVNKAAVTRGMSEFVFVTYSNSLAFFFLLPTSIIFYRKRSLPPLTWSILGGMFVVSMISYSVQILKALGIGYSSPTMASVASDLIPAFTFFLAIISGFEKLDLRVKSSRAKCIGTIALIAGALTVTLYKGLPITVASLPKRVEVGRHFSTMQSNWLLGGFLLASGSFLLALGFNIQTRIIREYPAELIVALIRCIFVAIVSAIISLIAEKDPNAWKLSLNMELIAIGYSALFSFTIRASVYLWACREKGPVYVAMFKPLGIFIAVVMGVTILGDTLYLGSVIGAAIIVPGFYAVIWGQAHQEIQPVDEDHPNCSLESSFPRVPLLQNKSTEI
ncbi:WAT1-related protein At3g28050-like isoform X2 [Juglans regia]|nr:WAT1-related protein At3g28050-like isoform X2 [Juglans regia]